MPGSSRIAACLSAPPAGSPPSSSSGSSPWPSSAEGLRQLSCVRCAAVGWLPCRNSRFRSAATSSTSTECRIHPRFGRPFVVAAVMAAMFMIAIEATIVSTAMPQIASQLGDLDLYSWVFASFLLTQTTTTVIFGKLADLYGRKPGGAGRHRGVSPGLNPVRIGRIDDLADRVPANPGCRSRRDPAGRPHDHRRPVLGTRARQDPRLFCQRLGHLLGNRAAGRRPHHPLPQLGLDFLDQCAGGSRRRGGLRRVYERAGGLAAAQR